MELDRVTTDKFDKVLNEVIDPQSELSLAELGLVKKFSYHAPEKTIVVHLDVQQPVAECLACTTVDGFILAKISQAIIQAMETEFPGWTIEVR